MAADCSFDHAGAFAQLAGDEREVNLLNTAFRKLLRQSAMRFVVFGNDQTTARVFIETVDDARPLFAANSGKGMTMMKQRVDQCVLRMTGARMHNQPGRFVQDEQVVVLKKNFKSDRFRSIVDLFRRRLAKIDKVAGANEIARPRRFAVTANKPGADQLLEARA